MMESPLITLEIKRLETNVTLLFEAKYLHCVLTTVDKSSFGIYGVWIIKEFLIHRYQGYPVRSPY